MSACRSSTFGYAPTWASDSAERSIDVMRASGLLRDERDRLRADAAAGLEHAAPRGVARVVVEQLDERPGLVVQPLRFALVIAVDVAHVS